MILPRKKYIPDAQRKMIVVDYMHGMKVDQILKEHQIARATLYRIIREENAKEIKERGHQSQPTNS